jgi:hypothetical protein
VLVQNSDDLLFRKAIVPDALVLVVGKNQHQTGLRPWARSGAEKAPRAASIRYSSQSQN